MTPTRLRALDRGTGSERTGISSQVRASKSRPASFFQTPPHCLKKNGIPDRRHWSRTEMTHSLFIGLAPRPLSPPTITQSILLRST